MNADVEVSQETRQSLALAAILLGSPIEAALIKYPRKVIVAPRQSGKTTAIIKIGQKLYGNQFVIVTPNMWSRQSILELSDSVKGNLSTLNVVPWINFSPNSDPFFVDDFLMYDREKQTMMLLDPKFLGGVTSVFRDKPANWDEDFVLVRGNS